MKDIKQYSKEATDKWIQNNFVMDARSESYVSKIDGSVFTSIENMRESSTPDTFLELGITEDIQNCTNSEDGECDMGFSPSEQKWYCWAGGDICSFGTGSQIKKGDIAYIPDTRGEWIESALNFWYTKDYYDNIRVTLLDDSLIITARINENILSYDTNASEENVGQYFSNTTTIPKKLGMGEWTAQSLTEAKLMCQQHAFNASCGTKFNMEDKIDYFLS